MAFSDDLYRVKQDGSALARIIKLLLISGLKCHMQMVSGVHYQPSLPVSGKRREEVSADFRG